MATKEMHVETHPSYGSLQIHRTSGCRRLFDSALQHHGYITLKVVRAEMHDGIGGNGSIMLRGPSIVEVCMSETQFARAITSMNMGSGVPCTISRVEGTSIPDPPVTDIRSEHLRALDHANEENVARLRDVADTLEKMHAAKARPTLKEVEKMHRDIMQSLDYYRVNSQFYVEQVAERMEAMIDDAKTEVEAHAVNVVNRLGMEAIAEKMPSLHLPKNGPAVEGHIGESKCS